MQTTTTKSSTAHIIVIPGMIKHSCVDIYTAIENLHLSIYVRQSGPRWAGWMRPVGGLGDEWYF